MRFHIGSLQRTRHGGFSGNGIQGAGHAQQVSAQRPGELGVACAMILGHPTEDPG